MSEPAIGRHNVGRIAERIVANELEFRGFRVSDLNREGTSANADLLAARDAIHVPDAALVRIGKRPIAADYPVAAN